MRRYPQAHILEPSSVTNDRGPIQISPSTSNRSGHNLSRPGVAAYPLTMESAAGDAEVLGENASYMVPESLIQVEFYDEKPVGIEMPVTVDLKVVDTVPGINRATASAQVKPATLETGLVVQVPPFVSVGDTLRISTETGEYLKKV